METGLAMDYRLAKYDGEPFTPSQVVAAAKAVLGGRAQPVTAIHDDIKPLERAELCGIREGLTR